MAETPQMRGSVYSTHSTSSSLYAWCTCEHMQKEEVWFLNTYQNKTPFLWLWKVFRLTCKQEGLMSLFLKRQICAPAEEKTIRKFKQVYSEEFRFDVVIL